MKVLKISYYAIGVLLMAWMVFSWLNIGFNNHVSNPVYHPYNLFILMKGWGL